MPDLVDLPLNQAMAMIHNSGLQMGELSYKPDISVNMVLNQRLNGKDIAAGDSIHKESVIDLVLGKGLSNQRPWSRSCRDESGISKKQYIKFISEPGNIYI